MTTQTTLLIDADYFFYRAASAAEQEIDYSTDLTVIIGDFSRGKDIVINEIERLRERFDTRNIVLTFTDTSNFRKKIDSSYKGNRIKRKPAGYLKLKNWGLRAYPSKVIQGLEADDVMGILATSGKYGDDFVIVSPDKDMLQIPCRIYNLKDEFTQTPEDAYLKLFEQALSGDNTDGYSGCKGIGPKRAGQLLAGVTQEKYWNVVLKAYEEAEHTPEDALRNLRLARILHSSDYDENKREPILYTPTSYSGDKSGATVSDKAT